MSNHPRVAVIGIGNEFRHDDGVGLEVARQLRLARLDDVTVFGGVSDDYALLSAWQETDHAFLIDSTVSKSEPGTIRTFDALSDEIPAELFSSYSTHALNIPKTIELARTLGRLPGKLTLIGIEGRNFSHGEGLSQKVVESATEVAQMIVDACKSLASESR